MWGESKRVIESRILTEVGGGDLELDAEITADVVIGDGVDVDIDVELLEIITEEGAPESVDVLILAPAMVTFEEVLVTEAKLSDKAAATASLVKGADKC